jgi:hypothetical protein
MSQNSTVVHRSGAVDLSPIGGALQLAFRGCLTISTMRALAHTLRLSDARADLGVVFDFRRAAVAFTDADLHAAEPDLGHYGGAWTPGAILVRPDDVRIFAGHAIRRSAQALPRRLFIQLEPALDWLTLLALRPDPWGATSLRR